MTSAGAAPTSGVDTPTLVTYVPGPAVLLQGPCTTALLAVQVDDPVVRACWYAVLAADPVQQVLDLLAASTVTDHAVLDRRDGGRLHCAGRLNAWVYRTLPPSPGAWAGATAVGAWSGAGSGGAGSAEAVLLHVAEPPSSPRLPLLTGVVPAGAVHVPLTWEGADTAPEDLGSLVVARAPVNPPATELVAAAPAAREPEPPAAEPPPPVPPAPVLLPAVPPERQRLAPGGFIDRVPQPVATPAHPSPAAPSADDFITHAPSHDDR